jgi:hypothetical protein
MDEVFAHNSIPQLARTRPLTYVTYDRSRANTFRNQKSGRWPIQLVHFLMRCRGTTLDIDHCAVVGVGSAPHATTGRPEDGCRHDQSDCSHNHEDDPTVESRKPCVCVVVPAKYMTTPAAIAMVLKAMPVRPMSCASVS